MENTAQGGVSTEAKGCISIPQVLYFSYRFTKYSVTLVVESFKIFMVSEE